MTYSSLVCDWNGTLFTPKTEEGLAKTMAYASLGHAVDGLKRGQVWKVADIAKLVVAKRQLKGLVRGYNAGELAITAVYDAFNARVLRGMPVDVFTGAVGRYSDSHSCIDQRFMLPVIRAAREGKQAGILSAAYHGGIESVLKKVMLLEYFGKIVAHRVEFDEDGKILGFTTDIYGRKAQVLEDEFFRKSSMRPETTLYAGDTDEDAPIAEILPQGNFIVPFLATDDFKQKMASKHRAFVPENAGQLERFLQTR